jgi:hypothetical protein
MTELSDHGKEDLERRIARAEAIGSVWARLRFILDSRDLEEAKEHAHNALENFRAAGIDLENKTND